MRPLPNWKWRRDPRVKLQGRLASTKHRIVSYCASEYEQRVIKLVMDRLADHIMTQVNRRAISLDTAFGILENIENYKLPGPGEWESPYTYSYGFRPDVSKEFMQIWTSLMFQLKIAKHCNESHCS
jgi:hypothetical protein